MATPNPQFRNYCFTLNNYTERQFALLKEFLPAVAKYAVVGQEKGEEKETEHLQGYVQLTKRERFTAIKQWFEQVIEGAKPHIEKCKASAAKNRAYCTKDGKYWEHGQIRGQGQRQDIDDFLDAVRKGATNEELALGHPVEFCKYKRAADDLRAEIKERARLDQLKEDYSRAKLRSWQRIVLNKLLNQNSRKITWVYDQQGGLGKTWFAKYLVAHHNAFYISGGKTADITYAYDYQTIVVFDFTRQQQETINYSLMEAFKNGIIFSSKYQSRPKTFRSAKVLALSNFHPDLNKLSNDRWQVLEFPREHGHVRTIKKEQKKIETVVCSHNNCNEINCFCQCHFN